jgi:hypothetical protein
LLPLPHGQGSFRPTLPTAASPGAGDSAAKTIACRRGDTGRAGDSPKWSHSFLTGSPLLPSRLALPMRQRRQIRLDFHLQPLRDAPRSHPALPPQTKADCHGPARGSRLLAGFELSAAFGALPVRPASTQTVLAHAPAGRECSLLVAASALEGQLVLQCQGRFPGGQALKLLSIAHDRTGVGMRLWPCSRLGDESGLSDPPPAPAAARAVCR